MENNQNEEKRYIYTPDQFYKDGNILLQQMKEKKFDVILAIANGGIPLGIFLAKSLGIEMYSIRIKSYLNHFQGSIEVFDEPDWTKLQGKSILVVDDLIDNGKTMEYLIKILAQKQLNEYKIAVLINKLKNQNIHPDYCARTNSDWIIFFWEAEYYITNKSVGH